MKKELLEQLLSITTQQYNAMLNGDYEESISLMDEKQEIIDEIERIGIWPFSEEETNLLKTLKEMDDKFVKEYEKQIEEVKGELKKINQLRRQGTQYIEPYSRLGVGLYFDHK